MTPDTIQHLFTVLQAAGLRAPKVYETDQGVKAGIDIFGATLSEITDDELGAAARSYVSGKVPFWPTPGQLLDLVPGLEDSQVAWRKIEFGEPLSLLELAVGEHVEDIGDGVAYRQAYRAALVRWHATPADQRVLRDETTGKVFGLSDRIIGAIRRLSDGGK